MPILLGDDDDFMLLEINLFINQILGLIQDLALYFLPPYLPIQGQRLARAQE